MAASTHRSRKRSARTKQHNGRSVGLEFTLPELIADLGHIPLERIRLSPSPGTATVEDALANNESKFRKTIVELVNGTLVEKPVGAPEAEAAHKIGHQVETWNEKAKLGLGLGADGLVRLFKDSARAPDFAFYRFDQFEDGKPPTDQVPWMYPDLAVEILSPSNTRLEMARKRREYFAAGTRLVWEFDLSTRSVNVYREPNRGIRLEESDSLDGDDVLPGFILSLKKFFASLRLS